MFKFFDTDSVMNAITREKMLTADFFKYDEVRMNRNSEARASKIAKELSRTPFIPSGLEVALVQYQDGTRKILNGNTRKWVWMNYSDYGVAAPSHVYATIYNVTDEREVESLYYSFDSSVAVETSKHKIQGYYKVLGLAFRDAKLASGMLTKALQAITHNYVTEDGDQFSYKTNPLNVIAEFRDELLELDKLGTTGIKNQAVLAGILMTMKKYGTKSPRIKKLVFNIKNGLTEVNGVHGADGCHYINFELNKRDYLGDMWGKTDGNSLPQNMNYILYCMERYMEDSLIKRIKFGKDTPYDNFWND